MTKAARPRLFERLKKGLEEGIAHARGEVTLRQTTVTSRLPPLPREYKAQDVRAIRDRLGMSQIEFATIFLVSVKAVQSWEQGTRSPSPAASRLLQVLDDPAALESLRDLAAR